MSNVSIDFDRPVAGPYTDLALEVRRLLRAAKARSIRGAARIAGFDHVSLGSLFDGYRTRPDKLDQFAERFRPFGADADRLRLLAGYAPASAQEAASSENAAGVIEPGRLYTIPGFHGKPAKTVRVTEESLWLLYRLSDDEDPARN